MTKVWSQIEDIRESRRKKKGTRSRYIRTFCPSVLLLFLYFCCNLIFNHIPVYAECSISLTTSGAINLNISSGSNDIVASTLNAKTDCANGYKISISGPSDGNLYLDGDNTNNNTDDYFSTSTGTIDNPTTILGDNNVWGYSIDPNTTISSNTFIGISSASTLIASRNTPTETSGDTVNVYYGANTTGSLAAGSYTFSDNGAIIYTMLAFEPETLEVTFDSNGGTIPAGTAWEGSGDTATKEISLTEGTTYGEMPVPTKEGYTFLGWSLLPKEYQAVEYIQFNGAEWIDTNLIPSNHTTEIKFDFDNYDNNEHLIGTASGQNYYHITAYDNKYYWGQNGSQGSAGTWTTGNHTIIYNGKNNSITLDDNVIAEGVDITSTANLLIGDRGNRKNILKGKVYYVIIIDKSTGEVVRNMLPCYRKIDNAIGMYDIENEVFYENQGTGTFGKGVDVEPEFVNSTTAVEKDESHTLYAVWGHNPTVTFNATGGTVNPTTKTYNYNSNYTDLPTPTREGYTFLGWDRRDHVLPSEYQEVEYIETSNVAYASGQYIDTGVPATDRTGFEIDFSISSDFTTKESGSSGWGEVLGVNDDASGTYTNNLELGTWTGVSANGYMSYGKSGTHTRDSIDPGLKKGERIQARLKNKSYTNPDGATSTFTTDAFTSQNTLYLFARHWGNGVNAFSNMRLYSLKLYDGDTVIRNYVPSYRKSDGVIGLYDTINSVFCLNGGTGSFNKGSDVMGEYITDQTQMITNEDHTLYAIWGHNPTVTFNATGGTVNPTTKTYNYNSNYTDLPTPTREGHTFLGWKQNALPNEYQEVDYIESTGSQWIDTGIVPNQNTGVDAIFSTSNEFTEGNGFGTIFGVRTLPRKNGFQLSTWSGEGHSTGILIFNSSTYTAGLSNDKIHISIRNGKYINPNNEQIELNNSEFSSPYSLTLFAMRLGSITPSEYGKVKLYNFKIYDGDIVIRNMIPCYRRSDNVIGLYDTVNGVFYTNQGTGIFNKGSNVENEYITSEVQMITNDDHTLYAAWREE